MVISGEKILMSAELKGCVTWFLYFWILRSNYVKSHHCRMCVSDFREDGPFCRPDSKRPILNRVTNAGFFSQLLKTSDLFPELKIFHFEDFYWGKYSEAVVRVYGRLCPSVFLMKLHTKGDSDTEVSPWKLWNLYKHFRVTP